MKNEEDTITVSTLSSLLPPPPHQPALTLVPLAATEKKGAEKGEKGEKTKRGDSPEKGNPTSSQGSMQVLRQMVKELKEFGRMEGDDKKEREKLDPQEGTRKVPQKMEKISAQT